MIILDTDIVSFLDRGNGKGFENLARRFMAVPDDERVCVTIIGFEEQMRGWLAQIAIARNEPAATLFTTSQRTFGVIPSPQILPALLIDRNKRPLVICASSVQAFTAVFTHTGIGTVRM